MSANPRPYAKPSPAPTNPARDKTGPAPSASPPGTGLPRESSPSGGRGKSDSLGDAWTDDVADRVQAILREEGLDLELVVFYDPVTEALHAVGYDGSPGRYFRALETGPR